MAVFQDGEGIIVHRNHNLFISVIQLIERSQFLRTLVGIDHAVRHLNIIGIFVLILADIDDIAASQQLQKNDVFKCMCDFNLPVIQMSVPKPQIGNIVLV